MSTLYIVGGPPRTAKTTIMTNLLNAIKIPFIAGDAVEHGLRNVLIDDPHQMLRRIEITGQAEYKASITEGGEMRPFTKQGSESELVLQAILGMLDYYQQSNQSVAFEGSDFSPDWVSNLKLPNMTIRAAFVGYTKPSHADSILSHAKSNPDDWINVWLRNDNGDETKIREWVNNQAEKCRTLKLDAESHGFPFFDISTQPYEEYLSSVQSYLITGEKDAS